jgi:hypothetical protein
MKMRIQKNKYAKILELLFSRIQNLSFMARGIKEPWSLILEKYGEKREVSINGILLAQGLLFGKAKKRPLLAKYI